MAEDSGSDGQEPMGVLGSDSELRFLDSSPPEEVARLVNNTSPSYFLVREGHLANLYNSVRGDTHIEADELRLETEDGVVSVTADGEKVRVTARDERGDEP